jgi:hypothetical protein
VTIALRLAVPACLCAVLIGCQTLTSAIPFTAGGRPDYSSLPEAEMRQAAAAIERIVASGERNAAMPAVTGINLDNEAIVHAVHTRAARVHLVEELRTSGFAWERRDGLLHARGGREYSRATTRRERDRHGLVVYSENQNRWELYENIVRANNLRPKALDAVKAIFAEARVEAMGPGQLYEDTSGGAIFTR